MDHMDLGTCDRNESERALVLVQLPSGGKLHFCAHHYEAAADRLFELGAAIVQDDRQAALYTPA